jgi:biotin synthase
MQSMIFMAGASGVMIGDYLTTKGRQVEDDLKMLDDLKLKPREDTQQRRARQSAPAA